MKFTQSSFYFLLFLFFFLSNCSQGGVQQTFVDPVLELQKKAIVYYQRKDYKLAIKSYEDILSIAHQNPLKYEENIAWAYYEIGFCYLVMERYKNSLPYFNTVINDYPKVLAAVTLAKDRVFEIEVRQRGR